jgi:dTDP-D-glucose 4,6-dehydratase
MTILVTGAAGFIGSNFILDWFDHLNEDAVSLDLLTYAGNLENLSSLNNNPQHHFIQGDIGDRELVSQLLQKYRVRAVVNFAAESHVDRSIHGPGDFIETNIVGTYNLLESVRTYLGDLDEARRIRHFVRQIHTNPIVLTVRVRPRVTTWSGPGTILMGCRYSPPTARIIMDPSTSRKNSSHFVS